LFGFWLIIKADSRWEVRLKSKDLRLRNVSKKGIKRDRYFIDGYGGEVANNPALLKLYQITVEFVR